MRLRHSPIVAAWVVAVLWTGAFARSQADPAPTPFPSPTPGASPAPTASPTAGAGGESFPSNPFPSPSPSPVLAGGNGYVVAGYAAGGASGGQVAPLPGSTSTPFPFPASQAGGFWIDLLGRISPSYLASISYDNLNLRGGDNALVSFAQGRALYEPHGSLVAFGAGLASLQRSTSNANMNALGLGADLLPDLHSRVTPYGSLFIYPHVRSGGVSATFTALDAGVMIQPQGRGGFFVRVGGSLRAGLPAITSPSSVTAVQLGLGSSF